MRDFLQSFVDAGPPEDTDFGFDWQRKRIARSWHQDEASGFWLHNKLHNRRTYQIPDRFFGLF